jgi:hypothetical protein
LFHRCIRSEKPAAAVAACAVGQGIDLVVDRGEAERAGVSGRDRAGRRADQQVLKSPPAQVDQRGDTVGATQVLAPALDVVTPAGQRRES